MKYQYHLWNEDVSFLITVPIKEDIYAKNFGRSVAIDFYSFEEDKLNELNVDFICEFYAESFINLDMLD